jgi:hypothetical protein
MTKRMDWRRARLSGRRTLDHRWDDPGSEFAPDRAGRWLEVVERRQREQRPKSARAVGARGIILEPIGLKSNENNTRQIICRPLKTLAESKASVTVTKPVENIGD